jgi:transcriptional regulator with XRE-family HTH domain
MPSVPPRFRFDGSRLHGAMEDAGVDDQELAVEAGCSKSLITLYRLGYRQPPPPRLVTLAALLGKHVEDFFVPTDTVVAS